MMLIALAQLALAAPPSSTLSGPEGTLDWQIADQGETVAVTGKSPAWTITHEAAADLTPKKTVHTDDDGTVTIHYSTTGAKIERGDKVRTVEATDLWDGDTLDIRLGANVAKGKTDLAFSGLDPASGKVYSFDTAKVADTTCGGSPCTQVRVQLTGLLRYVGPTWNYWYAADGQLMRFEGPAGTFAVGGAQ